MAEYRLRHPNGGFTITVGTEGRRNVFLRRGYSMVEGAPTAAHPPEERSYRELQAEAKERGIPANQSREELEKALAD